MDARGHRTLIHILITINISPSPSTGKSLSKQGSAERDERFVHRRRARLALTSRLPGRENAAARLPERAVGEHGERFPSQR
jgi:hypothetical protein